MSHNTSLDVNVTTVLAESLPHQSAALAVLWSVVLKSQQPLAWVNQALLPDHPEQLKQVIALLKPSVPQTLVLECFCPYHSQLITISDVDEALQLLTQPQPLFPGAVNGPTFTYQRLFQRGSVRIFGEWGNPEAERQFHQFQAACDAFTPEQESIPDDILPELV